MAVRRSCGWRPTRLPDMISNRATRAPSANLLRRPSAALRQRRAMPRSVGKPSDRGSPLAPLACAPAPLGRLPDAGIPAVVAPVRARVPIRHHVGTQRPGAGNIQERRARCASGTSGQTETSPRPPSTSDAPHNGATPSASDATETARPSSRSTADGSGSGCRMGASTRTNSPPSQARTSSATAHPSPATPKPSPAPLNGNATGAPPPATAPDKPGSSFREPVPREPVSDTASAPSPHDRRATSSRAAAAARAIHRRVPTGLLPAPDLGPNPLALLLWYDHGMEAVPLSHPTHPGALSETRPVRLHRTVSVI